MPVSLMLFGLPAEEYGPLTVEAEALGFEALWLTDHLLTPLSFDLTYPYSESGDPGYRADTPMADVWVTIGYLAALTRRIMLGSGVYILPLRNPFVTARSVAMAQSLAGGRVLFGIGTGWLREEFDAVGETFSNRGGRTDELLEVLPRLWTGEPVEHHGRYYRFPPVQLAPAPPRPPTIVVGGTSEAALRRAARYADGWYGPNRPLAETVACRDRLEQLRGESGAADRPLRYYVRLYGSLDAENVRRYAEAGFEHVVVGIALVAGYQPGWTLEQKREALRRLAAQVGLG